MNDHQQHEVGSLAVVDDDEAARVSIGQMFRLRGHRVELFESSEAALSWPGLPHVDCIIADIKMPGMDGEEFLAEAIRRGLPPQIILVTGHADVSMAVRCLKAGAYDFVEKPFDDDILLACVGRAVEKTHLRRESQELNRRLRLLSPGEEGRFGMVGVCRAMQDVYEQIEVVAQSDAPVLIVGETGAGKELVARAIHAQSPRARGPFVPLNAGALPESVLESELFGHARGAFTGASADRDGKLVTASGGTLLLDEIENLPERAQVELLRVLDDGQIYAVGEDKPREVDFRVVVTAKFDLHGEVQTGNMRADFYHRIGVLSILVPALRERPEDIPFLVSHFLRLAGERSGMPLLEVPEKILAEMVRYPWPGNVRELKNAVERMVITSRKGITGRFVPDESFSTARLLSLPSTQGRLRAEMERTEKYVVESALEEHKGEVGATARALGISRRALYDRMKNYELDRRQFRC